MITAVIILCMLPLAMDLVQAFREWDCRRHPLDRRFGRVVANAASIEETF
jgi:hypothetical protein